MAAGINKQSLGSCPVVDVTFGADPSPVADLLGRRMTVAQGTIEVDDCQALL